MVQGAVREVLEAVYEPIFSEGSFGFRPGRSAHQALRLLDRALMRGEARWILEADIESFFDSVDRKMLMEMLQERVADTSLLRLVGKCLHVGILDGKEYSEPDEGTAQGSSLSPLLGNVYLHHVLDLWFERDVLPRMKGKAILIRFADDFVIGFDREDDAKRVMDVLGRRFKRYGLRLHPEKTRLLPIARPRKGERRSKGPATLDLLGFTVFWRRGRNGKLGDGLQDAQGKAPTGHHGHLRLVSTPSTPTGEGAACCTHTPRRRPLQLLWRQRESAQDETSRSPSSKGLAQMAKPKGSA